MNHLGKNLYTVLDLNLANSIGISKALLIQIIKDCCYANQEKNDHYHFYDNQWWASGTYHYWAQMYPALGKAKNLQRLFLELEKSEYIVSYQPGRSTGNATKFYRVNVRAN